MMVTIAHCREVERWQRKIRFNAVQRLKFDQQNLWQWDEQVMLLKKKRRKEKKEKEKKKSINNGDRCHKHNKRHSNRD